MTGSGVTIIPLDILVYGVTNNYSPNELIGGIIQGDTVVTITNQEIAERQWPGPPQPGDKFIIDDKQRTIMAVEPKYLGSEKLVFVCQVRG